MELLSLLKFGTKPSQFFAQSTGLVDLVFVNRNSSENPISSGGATLDLFGQEMSLGFEFVKSTKIWCGIQGLAAFHLCNCSIRFARDFRCPVLIKNLCNGCQSSILSNRFSED